MRTLGEVGPPWVLRFLTDNWPKIQADALPGWMPVEMAGSGPRKRLVDVFGCGHYGCVMPTHQAGVVCKVSSDPSEAEFVKWAVRLGDWPTGIVRYHAIVELPGAFKGRPVSVIWREEAIDVGAATPIRDPGAARDFAQYHEAYRNAASFVRAASTKPTWPARLAQARSELALRWAWSQVVWEDGLFPRNLPSDHPGRRQDLAGRPYFMRYATAHRLAAALHICRNAFQMMANTNHATEVGAALDFYLEHGVLLADVHLNNIGTVVRDEGYGPERIVVITDPGHAVFVGEVG